MKVAKNYAYNVLYQVFILIVPLITVPYVSRVLGVTGIGINAYTNSIIQYFILFGSIGLNLYGNRTIAYYRDDQERTSKIFWEIALLKFITIAISYSVFLIYALTFSEYSDYLFYQSLLIIAAAFDISWFFMGQEDFRKTVLRNLVVKIISIALIFLLVKKSSDLPLYILILSLSQLLGNLTLWPYLKKALVKVKLSDLNLTQHISESLVMFIPQIAIQIYLVLNKTMLGNMTSVEAAGIFENADKIIKMLLAVVTASGTVLLPRVANLFKQKEHAKVEKLLYSSFDFASFISIPMVFGIASIGQPFAVWFFGSEFSEAGPIMILLSVIIVLIAWSNVIGQQYLLPTNNMKPYTFSVIGGAIVNLICNLILIPSYGVKGAALSTVVAEAVVIILQFYFVRKTFQFTKLIQDCWKYVLAGGVMYVIISFINSHIVFDFKTFVLEIAIGLLSYLVVTWLLHAKVYEFFKSFRNNSSEIK